MAKKIKIGDNATVEVKSGVGSAISTLFAVIWTSFIVVYIANWLVPDAGFPMWIIAIATAVAWITLGFIIVIVIIIIFMAIVLSS